MDKFFKFSFDIMSNPSVSTSQKYFEVTMIIKELQIKVVIEI